MLKGNTVELPLLGTLSYPQFDITLTTDGYTLRIPHRFLFLVSALGAYRFVKWMIGNISYGIRCTFKFEKKSLVRNDDNADVWAAVLGANEPIGRAYAKELAERKFNLVLIGDSATGLEKLAGDIQKLGRKVVTLPITFYHDADFDKFLVTVKNTLTPLNVRILVNAERVLPSSAAFHELKLEDIQYQIASQVIAPTILTHFVINRLLSLNQHGAVLNLTSGLATGVSFYNRRPLYGATKSYLDYLCHAVYSDYTDRGVYVHSIRHMLASEVDEKAIAKVARNSLKWVGRQPIIHGGFIHALKSSLYSNLTF
jgi:short-subunit dehydrogenase